MKLNIAPHTHEEIEVFAKKVGVSIQVIEKIEKKREWYILWEHDYMKIPK